MNKLFIVVLMLLLMSVCIGCGSYIRFSSTYQQVKHENLEVLKTVELTDNQSIEQVSIKVDIIDVLTRYPLEQTVVGLIDCLVFCVIAFLYCIIAKLINRRSGETNKCQRNCNTK